MLIMQKNLPNKMLIYFFILYTGYALSTKLQNRYKENLYCDTILVFQVVAQQYLHPPHRPVLCSVQPSQVPGVSSDNRGSHARLLQLDLTQPQPPCGPGVK